MVTAIRRDDFLWAAEQAQGGKASVLTFHGVPDMNYPWVDTSAELFTRCMRHLHANGYQVIALRELARFVEPAAVRSRAPLTPFYPKDLRPNAALTTDSLLPDIVLQSWQQQPSINTGLQTVEIGAIAGCGMLSDGVIVAFQRAGVDFTNTRPIFHTDPIVLLSSADGAVLSSFGSEVGASDVWLKITGVDQLRSVSIYSVI